ncbi:MAG: hypothetical protein J3K34DRAFT_42146 [Monoraphidium minutum]|nr:MAG: hypothetical protein J3K34DRAFT_42146 [Monoraphidium minutum]
MHCIALCIWRLRRPQGRITSAGAGADCCRLPAATVVCYRYKQSQKHIVLLKLLHQSVSLYLISLAPTPYQSATAGREKGQCVCVRARDRSAGPSGAMGARKVRGVLGAHRARGAPPLRRPGLAGGGAAGRATRRARGGRALGLWSSVLGEESQGGGQGYDENTAEQGRGQRFKGEGQARRGRCGPAHALGVAQRARVQGLCVRVCMRACVQRFVDRAAGSRKPRSPLAPRVLVPCGGGGVDRGESTRPPHSKLSNPSAPAAPAPPPGARGRARGGRPGRRGAPISTSLVTVQGCACACAESAGRGGPEGVARRPHAAA